MHSPGAALFLTFRLAGSIPKSVINLWKQEKLHLEHRYKRLTKTETADEERKKAFLDFHRRWFRKYEDVLHKEEADIVWLKNEAIADMVAESLKYRHDKVYRLIAFCIMSNHVHVVFKPLLDERSLTEIKYSNPLRFESSEATLGEIMQSLKGYTARQANKMLNLTGPFWESESYDHEVRNAEELARVVKYTLNNPVKAGLVRNWQDWRWSWRADK